MKEASWFTVWIALLAMLLYSVDKSHKDCGELTEVIAVRTADY